MTARCRIVELRRYTLHPGARETLIELFERELIEPQEALGLHVLGQFRDLDAPEAFVWLRGFSDMRAREVGLKAFYGGPVWATFKDEANATMIDSDDVLLLRPVNDAEGPVAKSLLSPARGGVMAVTTYPILPHAEADVVALLRRSMPPRTDLRFLLRTEPAPNNFPALPIREGEHVVATVTAFADMIALKRHGGCSPAIQPGQR